MENLYICKCNVFIKYLQFTHVYLSKIKKFKTKKNFNKYVYYKIRMRGHVHKIIFASPGYTKNVYYAKE